MSGLPSGRGRLALIGSLVLCGCLWGCSVTPAVQPAVEQRKISAACPTEICSLLVYLKSIKSWQAADLAKELEQARKNYATDKSEFHRMQYALLLTVAAANSNERRLALQLLETAILDPNSPAELVALARLLRMDLQERLKLEDNLRLQLQKTREAQLRADDAEKRKNEAQVRGEELERKIREEQSRADDLELKLDTLKNIERRLLEQDKAAPSRP